MPDLSCLFRFEEQEVFLHLFPLFTRYLAYVHTCTMQARDVHAKARMTAANPRVSHG